MKSFSLLKRTWNLNKIYIIFNLTIFFLNSRDIQASDAGHCSIEDAKTCMELVLLKLEKGELFWELCVIGDHNRFFSMWVIWNHLKELWVASWNTCPLSSVCISISISRSIWKISYELGQTQFRWADIDISLMHEAYCYRNGW